MEITIEELKKKFDELPEDLRWAIISAEVDKNIMELGSEHHLTIGQMGQLSLEVHMAMFGITPLQNFADSVQKSLNLPAEQTNEIVNYINDRIISKVRDQIIHPGAAMESTQPIENKVLIKKIELQTPPAPANEPVTTAFDKQEEQNIRKLTDSILAQKLSGEHGIKQTTTEHSLGNISKQSEQKSADKSNTWNDPYRLNPHE